MPLEMVRLALLLIANVIAVTAVTDSYPSASPDGTHIVFVSTRSGREALWVSNSDGSHTRLLYAGAKDGTSPTTPSWSPDGREIVFAMTPAEATNTDESDIYKLHLASRKVVRLTLTKGDDSHPHWSRDGRRIFFNSARGTPDVTADWEKQWHDIYSMAEDGSDVRRHTSCRSTCTFPNVSPDGSLIVHRCTVHSPARNWDQSPTQRNSEVCVTDVNGGRTRNISNNPAYDGWPVWSPDAKWIYFTSNRGQPPNTGQIFRMHPDGSNVEQLTDGPFSHAQPSFTSDGRALYVYQLVEFAGTEIGQVARVDVSTMKAKPN